MVSAAFLHTAKSLLGGLSLILAFSSWVLAAINIHKIINVYGGYNRIDPAFIVVAVLAMLWFLSIVALAGRFFKAHKAKNVLIITLLHCLYYLGTAISYTATRYKAPYNCPTGPLRQVSGCKGLIQALMAVNWIDFVLTLLYALTIYLLAKKHSTLPWTNRERGLDTDINNLCPIDDRTAEVKARQEHV